MSRTFRMGGIHPPDNKASRAAAVATMPLPTTVTVPLSQHIGAPATPAVEKGAKVVVGQLIGTAAGFVSSNIHSPVSGTVTSVDAVPDGGGVRRPAITISVEGDEWDPAIDRSPDLVAECALTKEEIVERIARAGVVGMGGAAFPTHVKLSIPAGKRADVLVINGVECEPWLTSDHRVMLERGEELVAGVRILARALGVERIYIGVEKNKPDAIDHLRRVAAPWPAITVVPLKVQYPQGGEKQLIEAVTRRSVPSGGLPVDVGVVVQNVSTALAVYEAVQKNKPLVDRVVTVTGRGLSTPQNLLVRIGTPVGALIEHCGGLPDSTGKVVNGGPMMGRALANLDSPVTKGTSGILVIGENEARRPAAETCIKCARCISVCPMGLEPWMLYKLGARGMFAEMEGYHSADCIECGSCQYTCPAALPLVDYIRLGKAEVMRIMRSRKS